MRPLTALALACSLILLWLMYGSVPQGFFFPMKILLIGASCGLLLDAVQRNWPYKLLSIPLTFYMALTMFGTMTRDRWIPWDWGFIATLTVYAWESSKDEIKPDEWRLKDKDVLETAIALAVFGFVYSMVAAVVLSAVFPRLPIHVPSSSASREDDYSYP